MPSISKIRFTNVVYEDGLKRYNDETFKFDGYNGAILLENGGGKTVFIQTALQAILPHTSLADRKIKQTLQLDNYPAHIAIEWILSDQPRHYLVTTVSLFSTKDGLDSHRYVYQYAAHDRHSIDQIPFVRSDSNRPADRGEISDYYQQMNQQHPNAHTFSTIKAFQAFIEDQYHIIAGEWESIVKINSTEGGVEAFFDECKQTNQLFDRLLIPTVEGAIAGHHPSTFVDTFEKHRAGFKLYKELKKQIEENKAIEAELNVYSSTYVGLFEKEQSYEQTKQKAKALLEEINRQQFRAEDRYAENAIKFEEWNTAKRTYEMKKQSLLIQTEQVKLAEQEQSVTSHGEMLLEENDQYAKAKNQYYSLRYAKLKQELREEEGKLALLVTQLEELDGQEEIQDLTEQLEHNAQSLKGYFVGEMAKSEGIKQSLQVELQTISTYLNSLTQELDEKEVALRQQQQQWSERNGKSEAIEEHKQRIRQKILSKPDQESIKDLVPRWESRLNDLDGQIVRLVNDNKKLERELKDQRTEIQDLEEGKSGQKHAQQQVELEIKQVDEAHKKLKAILGKLKPQWVTLDSLYLRQESIIQQMEQQLSGLNKEKDKLLHQERLAHRYHDDYSHQEVFFADPYVEQQLEKWKHQFRYLQTGIEFLESLGDTVSMERNDYPLWSITLITTGNEQEQLKQRILSFQSELQVPIVVMSTDEARAVVMGESNSWSPIVPTHWLQNTIGSNFLEWKEILLEKATAATNRRKEQEELLKSWENATEQLNAFLKAFPYESVLRQKELHSELGQRLQEIELRLNSLKRTVNDHEALLASQQGHIGSYQSEFNGLQANLSAAKEYLQLNKDVSELQRQMADLAEQIKGQEKAINSLKRRIESAEEEYANISGSIRDEAANYARLIDDPLYIEVKNVTPIFGQLGKLYLVEQRNRLKYAVGQLSDTRRELQLQINFSNSNKDRLESDMNQLKLDYSEVQEEYVFPLNGNEQINSSRNRMRELESRIKKLEKVYDEYKLMMSKQEQAVEYARKDFAKQFPENEPISFHLPQTEVKDQLAIEHKQLTEQEKYLMREKKTIDAEISSLKDAFIGLDRFDEAHHFKGPSVTANLLTEEEIQSFEYERLPFVLGITSKLKQGQEQVNQERERVNRAKDSFKSFCKRKITDVKMREMAVQGVDKKRTYQEVLEFQSHMQKRIQTVIKYNEASIMNTDKELEQYVTHINNHLLTIAEELKRIPAKTKVKVEDKWKEIYQFMIPTWSEEEGKNRIRKHIDWILEQLDSDRFLTAEGHEDSGKVRKELEGWIQSKQLLRVVMDNETMKVSCRKVTNDIQVTTRSYSWEQSNVWSGGEKWSKNMTLFLGILNYVAEKQKHSEKKMKRHRVVIMDNPFGKASSDHVLNPVFFIAEQLGFQIIALTAHAEGKFLRDYFPVIYSCRLRKATDSNKQIMTKTKHLHQAYFQDHEPQSLERLGEMEQLELF